MGVVEVYPFPFSRLMPGEFWLMKPCHKWHRFKNLLVQTSPPQGGGGNTACTDLWTLILCFSFFFVFAITDVYGWDNVPCKARADWQAMLLSGKKSLTQQLRLDQWDTQPTSHSKATCLACRFSHSVPNGFLWHSNGDEIQHEPACTADVARKTQWENEDIYRYWPKARTLALHGFHLFAISLPMPLSQIWFRNRLRQIISLPMGLQVMDVLPGLLEVKPSLLGLWSLQRLVFRKKGWIWGWFKQFQAFILVGIDGIFFPFRAERSSGQAKMPAKVFLYCKLCHRDKCSANIVGNSWVRRRWEMCVVSVVNCEGSVRTYIC